VLAGLLTEDHSRSRRRLHAYPRGSHSAFRSAAEADTHITDEQGEFVEGYLWERPSTTEDEAWQQWIARMLEDHGFRVTRWDGDEGPTEVAR
jgi:basic membrane lipoprotein Med (substrate-binding protein (PBP1-ABC) superfamily)